MVISRYYILGFHITARSVICQQNKALWGLANSNIMFRLIAI